jgi:hypothetical protein
MALHDFFCQVCGQVLLDVNVPVAIGATAGAPAHCGKTTAWIPAVGAVDAYEPFQEFEARDGQNHRVTVDSLRKLRTIERESEQQYRNGEGQPIVWRRWSQDASNRDVHTLDPDRFRGGQQPDPAWVKKNAARVIKSVDEPDVAYGPGISDATPSALDHLKKD